MGSALLILKSMRLVIIHLAANIALNWSVSIFLAGPVPCSIARGIQPVRISPCIDRFRVLDRFQRNLDSFRLCKNLPFALLIFLQSVTEINVRIRDQLYSSYPRKRCCRSIWWPILILRKTSIVEGSVRTVKL